MQGHTVQTKTLKSCHFLHKRPARYAFGISRCFQRSSGLVRCLPTPIGANWSAVPYSPGPCPFSTCMDMQKLHIRTFETSFNPYAYHRPVKASCTALGSLRHQPKTRHLLVSRCSATSGSDAAPPRRDVGRMFQQHKVLMEAGFSYDQASLILEITERRATPQPADFGASQAWQFSSCILQGHAVCIIQHANALASFRTWFGTYRVHTKPCMNISAACWHI
jgi:hypothetical protein